jgi:hypothetical protein
VSVTTRIDRALSATVYPRQVAVARIVIGVAAILKAFDIWAPWPASVRRACFVCRP